MSSVFLFTPYHLSLSLSGEKRLEEKYRRVLHDAREIVIYTNGDIFCSSSLIMRNPERKITSWLVIRWDDRLFIEIERIKETNKN